MTPHEFYTSSLPEELDAVAQRAGTSVSNLRAIAYGGSVGKGLAEKLAIASDGKMTELEILYPERYQPERFKNNDAA